jgi:hypothetical protein
MAKARKTEPKAYKMPLLKMAGSVKTIQINLGVTEVVELPGSCAKIHVATKIRILFFYPSTAGFSQEEENRQLERFHLTLKVSRKEACASWLEFLLGNLYKHAS